MIGLSHRGPAWSLPLAAAVVLVFTSSAAAHFKLLKPAAWIKEGDLGDPQKTGPCGPGTGDGAQPTMAVTTVQTGETIMVEVEETVHHPGWFRIALSDDRSTFKDPTFPNRNCTVDLSTVPTQPHDNVLMDGLAMDMNLGGSNRKITQMVKMPDKPCDKCTLQVIQVMADAIHSPPGCIYYHCADLKIVAASGGAAGGAGSTTAGSNASAGAGAGAAGMGTAGAAAGSGGSAAGASGAAGSTAGAGEPSRAGSGGSTTSTSTAGASTGSPRPAAGTSGGAGSTSTTSGAITAAGASSAAGAAAPAPAASASSSCAVSVPGSSQSSSVIAWLAGIALIATRLRRRRTR